METSSDLLESVLVLLTDTDTSSDLGECALALLTDTGTAELLVDTETSSGLEE